LPREIKYSRIDEPLDFGNLAVMPRKNSQFGQAVQVPAVSQRSKPSAGWCHAVVDLFSAEVQSQAKCGQGK
jgi:hypothetical protein